MLDEVRGRRLGLGEPVAGLLAAGDHDQRREALRPTARRRGRAAPRAAATGGRRTAPRPSRRSRRPGGPGRCARSSAPGTGDAVVADADAARAAPSSDRSAAARRRRRRGRLAPTGVGSTADAPRRLDRRRRRDRRSPRSPSVGAGSSRSARRARSTGRRHERADGRDRRSRAASPIASRDATRRRRSVSSRPSSSSASNSGGPTVRPVTATRTGACALPSFSPCALADRLERRLQRLGVPRRSVCVRGDRLGEHRARRRRRRSPWPRCLVDRRGRRGTGSRPSPGTSASVPTRVCTSGAIAANTSGSNRSRGHGTSRRASHGSHAAMNSSTGSARMYSPLNAASFFMSKNAGEWVTSSSRKSRSISRPRHDLGVALRRPARASSGS